MNKLFLSLAILISLFSCFISYNIGLKHGTVSCVNTADVLHSDTNDIMSIYISDELGIAHIYFAYNAIMFENGGDPLEFSSKELMYDYVSEMTAYSSCIHGYKDNLDYLIRNGYVYARTAFNDDEQYTELYYNGPNWSVDARRVTTYIISTFNHVEKIYNPVTKSIEYDSYTID